MSRGCLILHTRRGQKRRYGCRHKPSFLSPTHSRPLSLTPLLSILSLTPSPSPLPPFFPPLSLHFLPLPPPLPSPSSLLHLPLSLHFSFSHFLLTSLPLYLSLCPLCLLSNPRSSSLPPPPKFLKHNVPRSVPFPYPLPLPPSLSTLLPPFLLLSPHLPLQAPPFPPGRSPTWLPSTPGGTPTSACSTR